ncbi:4-hydroxy-3-methylbut-2-enyl diphosphate reductase [bacterium]|nr:4-hydroxy-3-methylbut-2-enyl diphosphate reductase [bacterium]
MKKLIVAKNIGFCFGVNRTVKMAENLLREHKTLYSIGDIVHNPVVMAQLKSEGLKVTENLNEIHNCPFIVRSHGIGLPKLERLKKQKVDIYDATCPSVKKLHSLIKKLDNKKYFVIIIGNRKHPEVEALRDYGKNTLVVQEKSEFKNRRQFEQLAVIGQTTLSFKDYLSTANYILENLRFKKVIIYNTICKVTEERQAESVLISKKSDMVIVLGGKTSSNTGKLYQTCKSFNANVHYVEKLEELEEVSLEEISSVGLVSGTSTPENFILAVKEKLKNKGYKEVGIHGKRRSKQTSGRKNCKL